jgi:hypothetical protein
VLDGAILGPSRWHRISRTLGVHLARECVILLLQILIEVTARPSQNSDARREIGGPANQQIDFLHNSEILDCIKCSNSNQAVIDSGSHYIAAKVRLFMVQDSRIEFRKKTVPICLQAPPKK